MFDQKSEIFTFRIPKTEKSTRKNSCACIFAYFVPIVVKSIYNTSDLLLVIGTPSIIVLIH